MATTVRFTDGDEGWEIFTEREVHKKLFTRLFGKPSKERGIGFTWLVPYGDLRIGKARQGRKLSPEERAVASARLAKGREARKARDGSEVDPKL